MNLPCQAHDALHQIISNSDHHPPSKFFLSPSREASIVIVAWVAQHAEGSGGVRSDPVCAMRACAREDLWESLSAGLKTR